MVGINLWVYYYIIYYISLYNTFKTEVIKTILFVIAGETSPTKVPSTQPVDGFQNTKRVLALIAKILILRNSKLFIIMSSHNYVVTCGLISIHPFM